MRDAKVDKKAAKQAAKTAKKQAKAERAAADAGDQTAAAARSAGGGPSPAERSAQAAERQVALTRWRVFWSAVGTLAAAATLWWTLSRAA